MQRKKMALTHHLACSLFCSGHQYRFYTFMDALFLTTSAVCVTGLASLDIGSTLSGLGQGILLMLIQLGGLGITTYTSLVFILLRNRVPVTDRLAVHQALLNKDVVDVRAFI